MLKRLYSIILLIAIAITAQAQELNVTVKVMHDRIQNVDKQVFRTMEQSIVEFLNSRKWTNDQFNPEEKINVNILLNLTERISGMEDGFKATLNIQASRPVYNSDYTSPTVNYIDRDVAFKYSQFNPLQYDDNRIVGSEPLASNLTAILAYYSYLIIGLDYESFEPRGGDIYFKKAQHIVNNAPEEGKSIQGWKAVEGQHNRYWIIDQMLNPRFKVMREYWYTYHRQAMDSMFFKPIESQKKILDGLGPLKQLQRENPGSILLQFFFNAKSDEYLSILAQQPKEKRAPYIAILQQVDVPNIQKYNSLNQ